MKIHHEKSHNQKRILKNLTGLCALSLAGCAMIPDMGSLPTPRADLNSYNKKENDKFLMPQADWWKLYEDPQLTQLIEEGLSKSPKIIEANARLQKANALALQANSPLFPVLSADGALQKYKQSYNVGIPSQFVPHGFQDSAQARLNFSYEIDFWGKNKDSLSAALSEAVATQIEVEQAKIIISTSIAATYAELARLYAELDAAKEAVLVRKQTTTLFQERFNKGLENQGSVEQSKATLAAAEAEVVALEELIELNHNGLTALLGETPERKLSLRPIRPMSLHSFKMPDRIPANFIAYRPDLLASCLRLEAAAAKINVAKAGFYPNINLGTFIGQQSLGLNSFFKSGSLISTVGPAINLPIFNAGDLEGKYREAWADYNFCLAQYESAIIQALHEVSDALTSQQALSLRLEKIKAALDASELAYRVVYDRYSGGIATYLEVLRAEDALILSRRAMANMRSRSFILEVALLKALGGGFQPIFKQQKKIL